MEKTISYVPVRSQCGALISPEPMRAPKKSQSLREKEAWEVSQQSCPHTDRKNFEKKMRQVKKSAKNVPINSETVKSQVHQAHGLGKENPMNVVQLIKK